MDNNVLFAFTLTLMAGMATGIGSLIAIFAKRTNTKFLSATLGFSAGVMIYVSMIEIFQKSRTYLSLAAGDTKGYVYAVISFFAGMILIAVIDFLIPAPEENPQGMLTKDKVSHENVLKRMGFMTALAIGIHNFPEGMATFTSALKDPHMGVAIALAIAIHNIPEGIATSVPIYFSCGSRKKAFLISFFSGITEPLGAVIGYLILRPFFSDTVFGAIFGIISGIMVYISLEELIPMAKEYQKGKTTIIGIFSGMVVIAISLLLFL